MLVSLQSRDDSHSASNSALARPHQPVREISMQGALDLPCYLLDDSVAVRNFYGREKVLNEIDGWLLVGDELEVMPKLKTVALSGMGGIGL